MERLDESGVRADAQHPLTARVSAPRTVATGDVSTASQSGIAGLGVARVYRLFTHQLYFGLEAEAFRAGTGRTLARLSKAATQQAHIELETLRRDFRLGQVASFALVAAMLESGLLLRDGDDRYRATELFHQYARASVVKPLSRRRAKALIDQACELAADLNDDSRNPLRIETIAVSGAYMSRRPALEELTLWVILHRRLQVARSRWRRPLDASDGLDHILAAIKELSSFIVVRTAPDKQAVQRPFSVVFQAGDDAEQAIAPRWEWLRDWTSCLPRRIATR